MYRVAFNIFFSFFHENENILKSHSIAIYLILKQIIEIR